MRIFSSATPSSSAAICASAVRMPCPSSTLPLAIETVPSRSKWTLCVRRRASESRSGVSTGLFMRGLHYGFHHPVVRTAAAQVLVERRANLLFGRFPINSKQSRSRHGDAAHAITALRRLLGDQRLLHRVQLAVRTEAFDGSDLFAFYRPDRQIATSQRAPIDQHEARAALAAAAAQAPADQAKVVAQDIEERRVAMRYDRMADAIHLEIKHDAGF